MIKHKEVQFMTTETNGSQLKIKTKPTKVKEAHRSSQVNDQPDPVKSFDVYRCVEFSH